MIATPRRSAVNTNDMLGLLMRDLDRYPMPNYDEQVELAKRVTAGDEEAKKQMVAANLRLVLHWARRYQDRGVDMSDLVQEGTFGLMRAVDKFDWQRGFRFSTYATWWIRQGMTRAMSDTGHAIRLPVHRREALIKAKRSVRTSAQQEGRAPRLTDYSRQLATTIHHAAGRAEGETSSYQISGTNR